METAIALGAIRRVTIDIANLTGQLAVMQSGVEYVRQVAAGVNPEAWERVMADDVVGHPEMTIVLRGEQVDAVLRLLAALDALE